MPFREGTVTAQDGKRLYYRDYGPETRGPRVGNPHIGSPVPAVCLGGLTRNSADFHRVASRLARAGRRVVCPDYRGRGQSDYDHNWRNYAPKGLVYDLGVMLTALGIGHVVVIGTSLGGLLAMGLAAARPTAVKGALLNDVGPELNLAGAERVRDYVSRDHVHPDWDSAVADLKTMMPDLSVPEPQDDNWLRIAQTTWRRGADGLLHYNYDINVARTLVDPRAVPDLWPLFRALGRVPVAVVRGADSDLLLPETVERMVAARGGDLITATVPGVGHAPNLDEPESREAIDALLARVDGAADH